jgi:hypothetical protein
MESNMPRHQPPTPGEKRAVTKRSKAVSAKPKTAKEHIFQNPFAVFTEWAGEADETAYGSWWVCSLAQSR